MGNVACAVSHNSGGTENGGADPRGNGAALASELGYQACWIGVVGAPPESLSGTESTSNVPIETGDRRVGTELLCRLVGI